jgi:putative Mg2+ transporter-C (MgtC) family protein
MLDLMRLPLGVLSGMGFIGAGAILRRGELVMGVTTAATLWYVTIMGLCFGGGQLGLGMAMLALGIFVLWALKRFEDWVKHDHHVHLRVVTLADGPDEPELRRLLASDGLHVRSCAVSYNVRRRRRSLRCSMKWRCRSDDVDTPPVVARLAARADVVRVDWRP